MKILEDECMSAAYIGCANANWLKGTVKAFASWIAGGFRDAFQYFGAVASQIAGGIGNAIVSLGNKIKDGFNWLLSKIQAGDPTAGDSQGVGDAAKNLGGVIAGGLAVAGAASCVILKFWQGWGGCLMTGKTAKAVAIGVVAVTGIIALIAAATWAAGNLVIASIGLLLIGPLIRFFVFGIQTLWQFNWQITDKQISQQEQNAITGLVGNAGTAIGTALGGAVCGYGLGQIVMKFNPTVASRLQEVLGEQVGTQIVAAFKALYQQFLGQAQQLLFVEIYANARKIIKADPDIQAAIPWWSSLIQTWGDEGNKPWSFRTAFNDYVQAIPDAHIKNFTQNFFQSAFQMCSQSALVVASGSV